MPKAISYTKRSRGFALVDVLVSAAILVVIVGAFAGTIITSKRLAVVTGNKSRASLLAEEGLEAARNIRDANFSNLTNGVFGLTTASNQYNLSGSQDTSGIFTRSIKVETVDILTKKVTSTVAWTDYIDGSITLVTYLTNPTLLGQAGNVTVNTNGAVRTGILGTSITGVLVTNNSASAVTIQSTVIGGILTTRTTVIAPGATVNLGTLNIPLVGGLLPTVITFADQSTKTLNLSI